MNQDSEERNRETLSMEEYLKRRQLARSREAVWQASQAESSAGEWKLAVAYYL